MADETTGVLILVVDAGNILGTGTRRNAAPENIAGVEMSSSYIGKVDKARKYAEEPERVNIHTFEASFIGNHNTYRVKFHDGDWRCECAFFATRRVCSHTMALQRMLDDVLTRQAQAEEATV